MRKSDLCSSSSPFKVLDLKMASSDFCGQSLICKLILALVFIGLLSTHLKENFKVKCPIDFFDFIIIFFRNILIILLLFSSKIF